MTVLVGFALHDAVVLVADGRVSYPDEVVTDDEIKWISLRPSLSLGLSGVVTGSSKARFMLDASEAYSSHKWRDEIRSAVIATSAELPVNLGPVASTRLTEGIAGAGYDEDGFFVTETLDGPKMSEANSQFVRGTVGAVNYVTVGGGDDFDLNSHLTSELRKLSIPGSNRPTAKVFHRQLVAAAAASIRRAAKSEFSVGTKVHFTIKRRGQQDFSGWVV